MNRKLLLILIAIVFICNNFLFGQTVIPANLTSSITYSGNCIINSDVYIQNGAEITFDNAQISIDAAKTITIEPGCKLNVFNGSTLTASGINFWQGIILRGIPTVSHVSGNSLNPQQGQLMMQNSTIEKANIGVSVGEIINNIHYHGGGILRASNVDFVNCKVSVSFAIYDKIPNQSYFKDCNFTWSSFAASFNGTFDTHIKIIGNQGIYFAGGNVFSNTLSKLDFINNGTSSNLQEKRGIGVYILSSSIIFKRGFPCYQPVQDDPGCIKCTGSMNEFNNLSVGILNQCWNRAQLRTAITGCRFENNIVSIGHHYDDNVFINRNEFYTDDNYDNGNEYGCQYGKHIDIGVYNCENADISDNEINWETSENIPASSHHIGIYTANTSDLGDSRSRIYHNNISSHFSSFSLCGPYAYGNYIQGKNYELDIWCNHYDLVPLIYVDQSGDFATCENHYDWYVRNLEEDQYGFPTDYPSNLKQQGDNDFSASNEFSPHYSPTGTYCVPKIESGHVLMYFDSDNDIEYYYDANLPNQEPTCLKEYAPQFFHTNQTSTNDNECPFSSYCNQFGDIPDGINWTTTFPINEDLTVSDNNIELTDDDFEDEFDEIPLKVDEKIVNNFDLTLYPNPTKDFVIIEIEGLFNSKINNANFYLYDLNGKLVNFEIDKTENENILIMNLENLNNSIYVLKVVINNQFITTSKIVLNK
ncbi:MAG: T9SS type A sorting domain-containing protein [Bacteroidetes bacterium]|jgi:hypothetical protein|nr:T9SS type A sorting domain-containing protein [Bacteroidota bacterium]MBT5530320.1 T9SS type A sorting domain-containing protein [Cytophagia bacterium]MBT3799625.1 T9SS type A sorting domain-containing protein [Bacteroidota bacterium]MBT3934133.1 T9SS type A sorting domain-containing protein [Bacteroidota bacterium]MBT4337598.1 T9SS type A sorting domain-containing protein [Bacteroidota bacterium]